MSGEADLSALPICSIRARAHWEGRTVLGQAVSLETHWAERSSAIQGNRAGADWNKAVTPPPIANLLYDLLENLMCSSSSISVGLHRHGREPIRLESFFYGWIFAFAMAAVRLGWGH